MKIYENPENQKSKKSAITPLAPNLSKGPAQSSIIILRLIEIWEIVTASKNSHLFALYHLQNTNKSDPHFN